LTKAPQISDHQNLKYVHHQIEVMGALGESRAGALGIAPHRLSLQWAILISIAIDRQVRMQREVHKLAAMLHKVLDA
jgi:hypothetical protein